MATAKSARARNRREATRILGAPRVPRKTISETQSYKRTGPWFKRMDRLEKPTTPSEGEVAKRFGTFLKKPEKDIKEAEKERFKRDFRRNINKPSQEEMYATYGDFQGRLEKEGLIKEEPLKKPEEKEDEKPRDETVGAKCPQCGSTNIRHGEGSTLICNACGYPGPASAFYESKGEGAFSSILNSSFTPIVVSGIAALLMFLIFNPIFNNPLGTALIAVGIIFFGFSKI